MELWLILRGLIFFQSKTFVRVLTPQDFRLWPYLGNYRENQVKMRSWRVGPKRIMTGVLIKTKPGHRDRRVQGEKERNLQWTLRSQPSEEPTLLAGLLISDFYNLWKRETINFCCSSHSFVVLCNGGPRETNMPVFTFKRLKKTKPCIHITVFFRL